MEQNWGWASADEVEVWRWSSQNYYDWNRLSSEQCAPHKLLSCLFLALLLVGFLPFSRPRHGRAYRRPMKSVSDKIELKEDGKTFSEESFGFICSEEIRSYMQTRLKGAEQWWWIELNISCHSRWRYLTFFKSCYSARSSTLPTYHAIFMPLAINILRLLFPKATSFRCSPTSFKLQPLPSFF